ncbi:hypothetical protein CCACVL1_20492, partial [Corchorus capsularis]
MAKVRLVDQIKRIMKMMMDSVT